MVDSNITQRVQTTSTVISHGGARLHDGSVVRGRVLASHGGDAYTVSVAGQRVSVRSQLALAVGSLFTARLQLRGNEIALLLQTAAETTTATPALQTVLASLGLPLDAESARLVQFAQELGIRLKPWQLKKALSVAKGFASEEDGAAELSVLLDDKGLESGEYAVRAVLADSGHRRQRRDDAQDGSEADNDAQQSEDVVQSDGMVMRGSTSADGTSPSAVAISADTAALSVAATILAAPRAFVASYVAEADRAATVNRAGALTAFNQLVRRRDAEDAHLHWLLLPFDWGVYGFSGVLRILWNASENKVNKMVITMQNCIEKIGFMCYYNGGVLERVSFSIAPPQSQTARVVLERLLGDTLQEGTGRRIVVRCVSSIAGFGETEAVP